MKKTLVTIITFFSLFGIAFSAEPRPEQRLGCAQFGTLNLLKGEADDGRVCVQIWDDLTGEPAKANFWWTARGGANVDLGVINGKGCFNVDTTTSPTYHLKAGGVSGATHFFIFRNKTLDLYSKNWGYPPRESRPVEDRYDPCIARCKQVPPPKETPIFMGKQCKWICIGENYKFGAWERMCNGTLFDKKTGKQKRLD